MNYITFDIETYSPGDLEHIDVNEFRVSVSGAYISWLDRYIAFMEDDTEKFVELLMQCDLVVGYNHIGFDLAVLQKYSPDFDLVNGLPSYDIMLEMKKKIGFSVRLDDLAKANLGTKKTDSYDVYKHYHKEGKWAPLIDYCMNDVAITERIFQMCQKGQVMKYNNLMTVEETVLDKPRKGKRTQTDENNMASLL